MNEQLVEMITDYNHYISNVPGGCINLIQLLRNGKIDDSMKYILDFSEGIAWLIYAKEEFEKYSLLTGIVKEELLRILEEINVALENKDFYLVADIFEYEVKEYFESLNAIEVKN